MPWDGINAVDGARKVLERLDLLSLGNEHTGLGKATLTVTQIKSAPEISHTVPDSCRIILDRRLLPGDDPEIVLRDIHDAVTDMPPWSVEVTRGAFMYPSEVGADCAVASAVRRASSRIERTRRRKSFIHRRLWMPAISISAVSRPSCSGRAICALPTRIRKLCRCRKFATLRGFTLRRRWSCWVN